MHGVLSGLLNMAGCGLLAVGCWLLVIFSTISNECMLRLAQLLFFSRPQALHAAEEGGLAGKKVRMPYKPFTGSST